METQIIREIRTANAWIRKWENGIVSLHHPLEINYSTFENFLENYRALMEIQCGEISPFLMNTGNVSKVDNQSKVFMSRSLPNFTHQMAMVQSPHNPLNNLAVKIYFYLTRPKLPAKVFNSDQKAIEWLMGG